MLFSSKKGLALGWLAKAPAPAVCPTGHRYLRSTWTSEKKSAYLGGPVGLANYDPQDRVVCQRLDANTVGMWKDPKKIIKDGLEVLWSYGLTDQNQQNIPWRDESEWWLVSSHIAGVIPLMLASFRSCTEIYICLTGLLFRGNRTLTTTCEET